MAIPEAAKYRLGHFRAKQPEKYRACHFPDVHKKWFFLTTISWDITGKEMT